MPNFGTCLQSWKDGGGRIRTPPGSPRWRDGGLDPDHDGGYFGVGVISPQRLGSLRPPGWDPGRSALIKRWGVVSRPPPHLRAPGSPTAAILLPEQPLCRPGSGSRRRLQTCGDPVLPSEQDPGRRWERTGSEWGGVVETPFSPSLSPPKILVRRSAGPMRFPPEGALLE